MSYVETRYPWNDRVVDRYTLIVVPYLYE